MVMMKVENLITCLILAQKASKFFKKKFIKKVYEYRKIIIIIASKATKQKK
jgi:hypothetical protein